MSDEKNYRQHLASVPTRALFAELVRRASPGYTKPSPAQPKPLTEKKKARVRIMVVGPKGAQRPLLQDQMPDGVKLSFRNAGEAIGVSPGIAVVWGRFCTHKQIEELRSRCAILSEVPGGLHELKNELLGIVSRHKDTQCSSR